MKNPLGLILLSAAVGGLSAALAMSLTGSGRDPVRSLSSLSGPGGGEDGQEMAERFLELERRNKELELRLAALESRPSGAAGLTGAARVPASGGEDGGELERLEAQLGLMSRTFTSEGPVPEVFVARVQEAMAEIQAAEDRERERQREQARDERIEERLVALSADLGLSSYQVDEMRVILRDQEDRRAAFFEGMRESGDPMSRREEMFKLFNETDEALRKVLSEDQYGAYQERGGGGFGFGPPRGRDGGRDSGRDGGRDGGEFGGARRRG